MPGLRELLTNFDPGQGLALPPDWRQGRTAHGGITAASVLLAALPLAGPDRGPLRSVQLAFVGLGEGHLQFAAQLLRAGRSVASVGVDVRADGGLAARALFVFGRGRQSTLNHDFSEPLPVRGPESCRPLDVQGSPATPAFIANFELRPAAGAMPLSAADNPELAVWVRHRDAATVDPEVALMALADALPPAALTSYRAPAPISTVTWSLDLLGPPPSGEWFLLRSASVHAADGYSVQIMQAWDERGPMLLRGHQCVAVFA